MSLLLVGVGLALTATFFVGSPFTDAAPAAEGAAVKGRQPEVPAIRPTPKQKAEGERADEKQQRQEGRPIVQVPEDKTLKISIPAMRRVDDAEIPYAGAADEDAFKYHAGVHLRGTGSPWQRGANVYIAGHRLGYVGTESWLGFWDLDNLENGDKVFVTDSLGRRYVYEVFKEFVVDPQDVYVTERINGKNVLTLQTCTLPDYARRLIVQAERVEGPLPAVAKGDQA
jgi:sortase A